MFKVTDLIPDNAIFAVKFDVKDEYAILTVLSAVPSTAFQICIIIWKWEIGSGEP